MFLMPVTKVELSWEVPSGARINGISQEYLLACPSRLVPSTLRLSQHYSLNTRMVRQVSPHLFRQI
jgi:hypothetical protein